MNEMHDVVAMMRVAVIKELPFGPEVTEEVLMHLATVPYRGDDKAYLVEAGHVIKIATKRAVQPLIDKLQAEADASRAECDRLQAQWEQWQRDFEEFRAMATPKLIQ